MPSTEKIEVARPAASFFSVDLKDYDIAEKTVHYIQVNHKSEKPRISNADAEEQLKKAEFNFMVDLQTLIRTISVDWKLLQLRNFLRVDQKERAAEKFSPVFIELLRQFSLKLAGNKIVIPKDLKKQMVDALYFAQPGSLKMLAKSNIYWWARFQKDIGENCKTCTACMSCGEI